MRKHWLAWAMILTIGIGTAWAAEPAVALAASPPVPLTLDWAPLEHQGRPGAWIPAPEVSKLNKWQIELRECRDDAVLRAAQDALRAELDALGAERQALTSKRLEVEIERSALAREEVALERERADKAERRERFSRAMAFLSQVALIAALAL